MFATEESEYGSDCFTFVDTARQLSEFHHMNKAEYHTAMETKYGIMWTVYYTYSPTSDISIGKFMTNIVKMREMIDENSFSSWKVQKGLGQQKQILASMKYIRQTVLVLVPDKHLLDRMMKKHNI
jgi:hypothetical protein